MAEKKEGVTAEEKIAQIEKSVTAVEGDPLTEEIEYKVITNQHIEYPLGDHVLKIRPLTISRYQEMLEFEKTIGKKAFPVVHSNWFIRLVRFVLRRPVIRRSDVMGALHEQSKYIAKETGESVAFLEDNLTNDDIGKILSLLMYGWLEGRRILKKNSIRFSDVEKRITLLRTLGV